MSQLGALTLALDQSSVVTVAANQHDATTLLPLIVELPAVAGKPGRLKKKPTKLIADK